MDDSLNYHKHLSMKPLMGLESKNLNLIVYLDSALDKHY